MADSQNFENHVRFDPAFHFFVVPVFALSLLAAVVNAVRYPGFFSWWLVLFLTASVVAVFKMRLYALRVQDRLICLEERLRLSGLADKSLCDRIRELDPGQLIGLRFASDDELVALAQRALADKLGRTEIKKAVRDWRPDYSRV